METHDCDPDYICINTYGSYYCQCSEGYESERPRICSGNSKKFHFIIILKILKNSD